MKKKFCRLFVLCLALTMSAGTAFAAQYPNRTVTIVACHAAGGITDLTARTYARYFEKYTGASTAVVNRTGGAATIGTASIVRAKPDGYTIGMAVIGPVSMQPLYGSTTYTKDDLEPLGHLVYAPCVIAVNKNTGIKTWADFIEAAKKNPGQIKTSVAAAYAVSHLASEQLAMDAGVKIKVMPYQGSNPAVTACAGGHTEAVTAHPVEILELVKSGDLVPLIVCADERLPSMPDVPTAKELGYDLSIGAWYGICGPKNMPADVLATLVDVTRKIAEDPGFKADIDKLKLDYDYREPASQKQLWDDYNTMFEALTKEMGIYMMNKK